jgi:hypothetical protein
MVFYNQLKLSAFKAHFCQLLSRIFNFVIEADIYTHSPLQAIDAIDAASIHI